MTPGAFAVKRVELTRPYALTMNDAIVVRVVLNTNDAENDSSIQRDWRELLAAWAIANNCEITRIEWTRLRSRFVHNEKKAADDIYWDVVEERKSTNERADTLQSVLAGPDAS